MIRCLELCFVFFVTQSMILEEILKEEAGARRPPIKWWRRSEPKEGKPWPTTVSDTPVNHTCPDGDAVLILNLHFTDSVEDGEKLVQSALDAFGRIGDLKYYVIIDNVALQCRPLFHSVPEVFCPFKGKNRIGCKSNEENHNTVDFDLKEKHSQKLNEGKNYKSHDALPMTSSN